MIIVPVILVSLGVSNFSGYFLLFNVSTNFTYCPYFDFCFVFMIDDANFLIFDLNTSISGNELTTPTCLLHFLVTCPIACFVINSHLCIPQVPGSLQPTIRHAASKPDTVVSLMGLIKSCYVIQYNFITLRVLCAMSAAFLPVI